MRTARGRSRRSTRQAISIRSFCRSRRSSSRIRGAVACCTCDRRSGKLIPLNTVATVTTGVGPLSVNHTGQLPSVTMSFNLKPGYALGDAVNAIEQAAATTLPATVTTKFQGTAQAFQESLQGLGLVLIMAIVVIYIVLGILYESFTQPLIILSGLPCGGLRRAADADDLQDRSQPLRVRRHHHARRARQEERHHDGRLRGRSPSASTASRRSRRFTKPAWCASARS